MIFDWTLTFHLDAFQLFFIYFCLIFTGQESTCILFFITNIIIIIIIIMELSFFCKENAFLSIFLFFFLFFPFLFISLLNRYLNDDQSPEARYSFGKINGYYVGYRPVDSGDASVYKTITISDDFRPEITLTNLERKTKYEIVVQAFNSKGPGILSDPILVETYHQGKLQF